LRCEIPDQPQARTKFDAFLFEMVGASNCGGVRLQPAPEQTSLGAMPRNAFSHLVSAAGP
jgi:hypothetical protein